MNTQERKVVVIGAGFVGTTYVYALMHTGLAGEIVLIDLDQRKVKGEVMDLEHGLAFILDLTRNKHSKDTWIRQHICTEVEA